MRIAILGNLANVGAQLTDYLNRSGSDGDLLASPGELRIVEEDLARRQSGHVVPLGHVALSVAWGASCRLLPRSLNLFYRHSVITGPQPGTDSPKGSEQDLGFGRSDPDGQLTVLPIPLGVAEG